MLRTRTRPSSKTEKPQIGFAVVTRAVLSDGLTIRDAVTGRSLVNLKAPCRDMKGRRIWPLPNKSLLYNCGDGVYRVWADGSVPTLLADGKKAISVSHDGLWIQAADDNLNRFMIHLPTSNVLPLPRGHYVPNSRGYFAVVDGHLKAVELPKDGKKASLREPGCELGPEFIDVKFIAQPADWILVQRSNQALFMLQHDCKQHALGSGQSLDDELLASSNDQLVAVQSGHPCRLALRRPSGPYQSEPSGKACQRIKARVSRGRVEALELTGRLALYYQDDDNVRRLHYEAIALPSGVVLGSYNLTEGVTHPVMPAPLLLGKDSGPMIGTRTSKALDSATCKSSAQCHNEGQCTAQGARCVAASDADCARTESCRGMGYCSARNGKCIAVKESDCLNSTMCREQGDCAVYGESCRVGSDEHCRNSNSCKQFGNCSRASRWGCEPSKAGHCIKSEWCKKEGKCSMVRDPQIRYSDSYDCKAAKHSDCRKSAACKKEGRCIAEKG